MAAAVMTVAVRVRPRATAVRVHRVCSYSSRTVMAEIIAPARPPGPPTADGFVYAIGRRRLLSRYADRRSRSRVCVERLPVREP